MSTSIARSAAATAAAVFCLLSAAALVARAQNCGSQVGGATCPDCLCCSKWGWCGNTPDHCGAGCQSQCSGCGPGPVPPGPPSGSDLGSIVPRDLFERLLLHRNDGACLARGFYTYEAFLNAAGAFPDFAGKGRSDEQQKREVAAFLGQTSHETTGGWATAPDGPYSWGYCFKQERDPPSDYCVPQPQWPCAPGRRYFGRGPIQLSFNNRSNEISNYNYGPAGQAIGVDLLNNPDLVASDPVVSFKTALWFWMTPRDNKPSCHAVITGEWRPSPADNAAGRVPGYGVITNIINGGLECGHGSDPRVADRIGFYKRYCDVFGIGYGDNLDCGGQRPFNAGISAMLAAE
ncbi:hypothetical protein PR202_gb01078 [Eleusine coracana subsp. coracana]|uniref:chitinase n=1 Tax=Eleusine coracana subsp. coracana TaxID=191504 RepID=A0AAV5DVP7_ELECO|nr:hypothetical protein PR202_gb01078 [Eleusine coracana subsp. coracana]